IAIASSPRRLRWITRAALRTTSRNYPRNDLPNTVSNTDHANYQVRRNSGSSHLFWLPVTSDNSLICVWIVGPSNDWTPETPLSLETKRIRPGTGPFAVSIANCGMQLEERRDLASRQAGRG